MGSAERGLAEGHFGCSIGIEEKPSFALATIVLAFGATDQVTPPVTDEPILEDGRLVFSECVRISKFMADTQLCFKGGEQWRKWGWGGGLPHRS